MKWANYQITYIVHTKLRLKWLLRGNDYTVHKKSKATIRSHSLKQSLDWKQQKSPQKRLRGEDRDVLLCVWSEAVMQHSTWSCHIKPLFNARKYPEGNTLFMSTWSLRDVHPIYKSEKQTSKTISGLCRCILETHVQTQQVKISYQMLKAKSVAD